MALTITEPFGTGKRMAYSKGWMMLRMVSTNVNQPNFKFCVRFFPTGATPEADEGWVFIPYITSGNFLNVCEFADNVMNWDRSLFATPVGGPIYQSLSYPQGADPDALFSFANTNAVGYWTLQIAEGYDVTGVFTIDIENAESYPCYYLKGAITARQSGDGTALGDYWPPATSSINEGWLTWRNNRNSPWEGQRNFAHASQAICIPTFIGHKASMAHMNDDGGLLEGCIATKYRYTLYNGDTSLQTEDIIITYDPHSTDAREKMLYVGIGLDCIQATNITYLASAKKPSANPTWTHYTINLLSNIAQASQTIIMYRSTCFVKPYTLRWTADHGGVEHYTFDNAIQVTEDVERVSTYSHGQTSSGAIWHRLLGEQTAATAVTQMIELQTKPISVSERRLLATILRSSSLELWTPDGYTFPVVVETKSNTYRVRDNFTLDTFTVKLKLGSDAGTYI